MRRDVNSSLTKRRMPAAVRRQPVQTTTGQTLALNWLTVCPTLKLEIGRVTVPFQAIILMILIAGAALAYSVIERSHQTVHQVKLAGIELKQSVEQLEDGNRRLRAELEALDRQDPQVIESLAREQLGLARRGEVAAYPQATP